MSHVLHDLRCTVCGVLHLNVAVESGELPRCDLCHGETKVSWEGGKAPGTDVYGHPKWNEGVGQYVSSHREAIKIARAHGYEGEAGDKVGGARKEHRILGKAFSYRGQGSRVSTGEGR